MKNIMLRIIYNPFINKVILLFIKLINTITGKQYYIPPTGINTYKIINNKKIRLDSNQSSYLTKIIYWKGLIAFEYSGIFIDIIKSFRNFFDIGANIGYYSIIAATINKDIKVYAFEPSNGPYEYLVKNVQINHLNENVNSYSLAISNSNSEIEFFEYVNPKYKFLEHNLGGTSSIIQNNKESFLRKTLVKTITLESFLYENNIEFLDLIKIDTEGFEFEILNSSANIISKFRPIIICETLFNGNENKLNELFLSLNYKFYNHRNNKLIQVNTISRIKDDGIRDCFFVPEEKCYLVNKYC